MQFFPAALSHGAQFSRPGGLFELTDAKPGQGFHDLFSAHLNDPKTPDAPPPAEQPWPQATQDRPFVESAPSDKNHAKEASPEPFASENQSASSRSDVAEREEGRPAAGSAEPAKDAGQRQDAAKSEQGKSAPKVPSDDRPVSEGTDAALAADVSDESLVVEVQELLGALAAVDAQRKGGPDAAGISSRIEALHELLRQFRDAPPASRSELAVALGEQIRGLQRDLAAGSKAEVAVASRGKAGSTSRAASAAEQRIEALLHRLEARTAAGHEAEGALARRVAAALSAAAGATAVKDDQGGRARPVRVSTATIAAVQEAVLDTSARKHGDGGETGAIGVRRTGKGQEVAARPASREQQSQEASQGRLEFRGAVLENSSANNSQTQAGADDSALSADQLQKSVAADADRTPAGAKGQEGSTRTEAATHNGIAAAANRSAVVKDGSAQTMQQVDSQRQDGPIGASEKARVADSTGTKNQPDARQGFFGQPDREKTASRAVQTTGSGKNVPESVTQASAQNAQAQFQQRVESPVSTRSAQVYQQVENGAFKNLGQGVKQLVIRLDPADLGQISVILQVRGKEVQAVLRSSNQETSLALSEQMGQLRSQLEAQGLKVGKLEVQTQLADSQSQSQWQGAESHNRYQENQELAMSAKRWRTQERTAPELVRDVQNSPHRENLSQSGLDIFA
ncbi:MAG: flagellar hook-length control protein FliK [Desulfomicrobium sp.]|nr:flagellar hook-length control protein FliK [Pseudomonadota bacterium]MBV1714243.1 flagellar hook-length control protein FliK [Desulfomicrobium sp.]MBU4570982.1 flagellar hook-length control protein FliK [Pseudomonadota bacterium]MBU4594600.1 flagellar hook-length control protein FliK [Pseudomonadota bacterium]MBV1721771.1 flagellar hook-length control protein FliK [Desulfomicrobium sp.]